MNKMNTLKTHAFAWFGIGILTMMVSFIAQPSQYNIELWFIGGTYVVGLVNYTLGLLVDEFDRILNPPIINKIEIQEKVDKIA